MSLDMLRYMHPDLEMVIAGGGPQETLRHVARRLALPPEAVRFAGAVGAVGGILGRAAVVWVTGRTETGVQVALEALAAGRPVVAAGWPKLAEVVQDGETGLLVPPADRVGWARQTHRLLEEPALAARLAEAGRRFVEEHCRPDQLARRCADVYRN